MGDLFDIGKAGISAYKNSLATTGQNIANVGTEGYARRDASIEEISVANADVLTISKTSGLGVRMAGVTRAFDQFLDLQLQSSSSSFSFAKSKSEVLARLENVLIPKSATVSTRIGEFFDGLSNLAQDPSDMNLRTLALSGAKAVSREISNLHSGLTDLRTLTQDTLKLAASEFNSTIENLSNVQNEILGNANKRGAPNILLDQRDKLLSKLSELADISVEYQNNGGVSVSLGQLGEVGILLKGNAFNQVSFELDAHGIKAQLLGPSGVLSNVHFSAGQLAGLVSADYLIGVTASEVDTLAQKFVQELNSIHKTGLDLNGDRGTDLFSLENIIILQAPKNLGNSTLRVEGYSEILAGSELEIEFNDELDTWSVTSTNGAITESFATHLNLHGLTFDVQGTPINGDKFSIKISSGIAANMKVLIVDASKLAATGLHTVTSDLENTGNSELNIGYFDEISESSTNDLTNIFSEIRNAANPIRFNSSGVLGVIENVDFIKEMASLKSQTNLRIFNNISNLSESDNLILEVGDETFQFSLAAVFSELDTTNDLAEILNSGAILSSSQNKSFNDLGLHAVASGTSFVVSSAFQPINENFAEMLSGSLGGVSGAITKQDDGASDLSVFTKEGIQVSGKILSELEEINLLTKENGFSTEAVYRANYLPTLSNEGYAGAVVSRLTPNGLAVVSLSGAGIDDGTSNNVSVFESAEYPTIRTQLTEPLTFITSNGRDALINFDSGMMAGQIAEQISIGLGDLGIGAEASNIVEFSEISDGLLEFELIGDNLESHQISFDVSSSSYMGLVTQINSLSDTTGVNAYLSGDAGIVLKHTQAGDITLKNISLEDGASISVNQLDHFGERLLENSILMADGQHLVVGGNVQVKSSSDFAVSYNGNELNSSDIAFEMGFSNKIFDIENDYTDINFYADYKLDGRYADADNINVVASASQYNLTLSDPVSGDIVSSFDPQNPNDFSSSVISRHLVESMRNMAPSTVFYGSGFTLEDGFPSDGSQIIFAVGEQNYTATLNIDEEIEVQGLIVEFGDLTLSGTDALSKLIAGSHFTISGPEDDRLEVNFEMDGNDIRLMAAVNNGVVSGHGIVFAPTNLSKTTDDFHIDDESSTEIYSRYFSTTVGSNENIGTVFVGLDEYEISYSSDGNSVTWNDGEALPSWMSWSTEFSDDGTQVRIKISTDYDVSRDATLKLTSNSDSQDYGIATVSAQLLLTEDGLRISNIDDQRVKSIVQINSLASEVLSIDGMRGEDLIFISSGVRNPLLIGEVATVEEKATREYSLTINEIDPTSINIFDVPTGHLVGSRSIADDNSTLFQGLSIDFEGVATAGDTFKILMSDTNSDDANNLNKMLKMSLRNSETGEGGYSEFFGQIVSKTGAEIQANQQNLETREAAYQLALDNKGEFTGVDLDTEAARLMEQQQAYQALARVLTTARELLDTLLRSM